MLGDTYHGPVESLNRIAAAELYLAIVPPVQRGEPDLLRKRKPSDRRSAHKNAPGEYQGHC